MACEVALDVLRRLGAETVDVDWPGVAVSNPATWTLILGIAAFTVIVTGLSLGFSLLVLALVGLPLLGLTLRLASWFAVAERSPFVLNDRGVIERRSPTRAQAPSN